MTRRIAALALAAGTLGVLAAFSPANADPSVCVNATVALPDQDPVQVNQCVPPALP